MYTNYKWPNPIVVKLENVEPAFTPSEFETVRATNKNNLVILKSKVDKLGDCKVYKMGFEYRSSGEENEEWASTGFFPVSSTGYYEIELGKNGNDILSGAYEYRAVLLQDGLKIPSLSLNAGEIVSSE